MSEAALKQLEKVQEELSTLRAILSDNDTEKQRISKLIWGTPDFHVTNPEGYEKLAPYADPNKPPFNSTLVMQLGFLGSDPRLTYEQIAALEAGETNPTGPWDNLIKGGDS